ncbi:MAG: hypothetical protein ACJAS9_000364 [Polaribacter sp.]|jgi:hypothetical protein
MEIQVNQQLSGLPIDESNKLLFIQQQVLELTITNSDYQSTLDKLCELIEGLVNASLMIKPAVANAFTFAPHLICARRPSLN